MAFPGFDILLVLILMSCGIIATLCIVGLVGYKLWKKLRDANNNLVRFITTVNSIMVDAPILEPEDYADMMARADAYEKYLKGDKKAMIDYWKGFYAKKGWKKGKQPISKPISKL